MFCLISVKAAKLWLSACCWILACFKSGDAVTINFPNLKFRKMNEKNDPESEKFVQPAKPKFSSNQIRQQRQQQQQPTGRAWVSFEPRNSVRQAQAKDSNALNETHPCATVKATTAAAAAPTATQPSWGWSTGGENKELHLPSLIVELKTRLQL